MYLKLKIFLFTKSCISIKRFAKSLFQDLWLPDICLVNDGYIRSKHENKKQNNYGGIFLRPTLQIQWALHVYENGTILNVQR